jgi:hypothetical protein
MAGNTLRRFGRWITVPRIAIPHSHPRLSALHSDILSLSPTGQLSSSVMQPANFDKPGLTHRRPSFDSIQALLLTCFVLLNDMKAEASWALMGLTCRLAQSLGLHRTPRNESRDCTPPNTQSKEMVRRRLWWSVVWHDTLTSLSFDR